MNTKSILYILFLSQLFLTGEAKKGKKWKVHLGPITIGNNGIKAKPQFKVGFENSNVNLTAGVGDVRDGLSIGAEASGMRSWSTSGNSVKEVLTSIHEEDTPITKTLKKVFPTQVLMEKAVKEVLKEIGNIGAFDKRGTKVDATVTTTVGVGGKLGFRLPWRDADGYTWVGAVVGVDLGLPFEGGYQVGTKGNKTKIIIDVPALTLSLHIQP